MGNVASGDQALAYDGTSTGLTLTMHNSSAVVWSNNTLSWQHDPLTGAWNWQHSLQKDWTDSWGFDATGNTWTDGQSGEIWSYEPLTKTWTSSDISWKHDATTNRWINDPGSRVWEYDAATGHWTYDPDGLPWVFTYNFLADVWYQVTDNEGALAPLPPRVIAQKAVIDSAYEAVRIAGGFAASGPFGWQAVEHSSGVWSAYNAAGRKIDIHTC